MTVAEVMRTVIDLRGVEQAAVLESQKGCDPSVRIDVGSGPWPRNFALISVYGAADMSLKTHGFDRQRDFLKALDAGEGSLKGCGGAVLAFATAIEGGCGYEALDLGLDEDGHVANIGPVYERPSCVQQ